MKNIYLNIYKPNLVNLKKAKKNVEDNNVIGIQPKLCMGLRGMLIPIDRSKKFLN